MTPQEKSIVAKAISVCREMRDDKEITSFQINYVLGLLDALMVSGDVKRTDL